ncbi:VOC family protein [Thermoleophilia bacterium SCSIO 60948]|nr:VOC family protein [Thermoleophilia bacterium SCSIO 60948]
MPEPRTYPAGVPCWVDLETDDIEASCDFYARLFGWELADVTPPDAPGSYFVATLGGADVAAIGPGDSGAWNTYIAVDDAEAAAAAVTGAGGRVTLGPEAEGPAGVRVDAADPQGACFRLWQAGRRHGAQRVNDAGAWNFSHLATADADAAIPFYADVFGWEVAIYGDAGMARVPGYGAHLAATSDPGIYERQANAPDGFEDAAAGVIRAEQGPAEWQVMFTVDDRDDAAAEAERLGGEITATNETDWTRIARIRDPQGAALTLSQFTPPDA